MAAAIAHTKPPTQPSTVLCGLSAGASLVLPRLRPTKNAPESLSHVMTNGSSRYGALGSFRPRRTSDESIHGMIMPAVNTSARS